MRLACLLALVIFCTVLTGKSFAQDSELTADEIIQILQENPDVLADAKAEIVNQLRDRGYNVSENEITDERLFSQIRSDDRVRQLAANELAKRGFGPAQQDQTSTEQTGQQAGQPSGQAGQTQGQTGQQPFPQTTQRPGTTGQPTSPFGQQGMRGGQARPSRPPQPSKGPSQDHYPFRNLPALRDLYTQTTTDETKLKRFNATLFHNSTAATDKTPLSVPMGPDYVINPGDELVVDY